MNIFDFVNRAAAGKAKVAAQRDNHLRLQLINRQALLALRQGTATPEDINHLITARNMAEAIRSVARLGVQYKDILTTAHRALREVGARVKRDGTVQGSDAEVAAVADLLELHEAQLELATVIDMENAVRLVNERVRSGHVDKIGNA